MNRQVVLLAPVIPLAGLPLFGLNDIAISTVVSTAPDNKAVTSATIELLLSDT